MKFLISWLISLPFWAFAQQNDFKQIIKEALANKSGHEVCVEKVLPDKQTAVETAEPILFKVYGKEQILEEKPYKVDLVDGYWILTGTLPKKYSVGGTFLIILSAKDGRVIKLIHGK